MEEYADTISELGNYTLILLEVGISLKVGNMYCGIIFSPHWHEYLWRILFYEQWYQVFGLYNW